ncbi:BolA family protein [Solimicrobium silvestre]|uniref:Stress-induced morphogen n=1 Tax=Solimicrobium silvestre TaxID=2099400 RepID=A0A2S9GUC3_9BURK|nr:BolA family protein [Solimicrobium silvestre]PRC91303.1 Stress-induced morphogen [Solimicrobium silvestre]
MNNLSASRIAKIEQRLAVLNPISCQIEDDSALHAGHAGAASGAGHFRVTISSEKFNGIKSIQRHRLVYDAVGDLMQTDIHALVITALAPSEVP